MAMGVVALVALVAVQLVVTYSLLVGAGRSSTHVLQPNVAGTPESMDWHEKGGVKEEQVGSWPGGIMAASAAAAEYSTKEDEQYHNSKTGLSVAVRDEWEIIPSSASRSDVVKLSNGTEVQLFPSSHPHHGHVNETRRKLGIFNNAHHAHAVTEHGAGVYPLSVVTTSNVILRVFHLGFVLSSQSLAPALDAAVDSRH